MKRLTSLIAACGLLACAAPVFACTGITLKTKSDQSIVARTIEWAGSDMNSYYVVAPRGFAPYSKYAYAGIAVEMPQFVMEGINEKGLSAGLFYFPNCGKYESEEKAIGKTRVSDFELVGHILASCATVDEVKEAMKDIYVFTIDPRSSTVHFRFAEESGRQIVLEIIDEQYVFYENTVGVLTNSPSFDFHLMNLNSYINLAPGTTPDKELGTLNLHSYSAGSRMLGLPGDFSATSRFIRAAFMQNTAPVQDSIDKTVAQAFHIMNLFDLPVGAQTNEGLTPADIPSATHVTTVTDLQGHRIYYRTMHNCEIRCIDLNRINFRKIKEFYYQPVDKVKAETIHNLF